MIIYNLFKKLKTTKILFSDFFSDYIVLRFSFCLLFLCHDLGFEITYRLQYLML